MHTALGYVFIQLAAGIVREKALISYPKSQEGVDKLAREI